MITVMPLEPVRRFSVAEYHEMKRKGVLEEDEPSELLEGWLLPKMSRNPPHDLALFRLQGILFRHLPAEWICFSQSAITTADSEPEPDIAIVEGPDSRYRDRHPEPSDMALAVEIADSTLPRDRGLKKRIYARAGILEYWIVNIPDRGLEVFTEPSGDQGGEPTYAQNVIVEESETITLRVKGREVVTFMGREILP